MPAVARQNDTFKTGHPWTVKTSTLTGPSSDVFVNGRGVERMGDPSVKHLADAGPPHIVKIKGGSDTVFVNGKPIARVGDPIDLGSIISGSGDVFAG